MMNILQLCGDVESNPGQGITSVANVKLDQIRTILSNEHKFHIISVCETWLTEEVANDDIHLEGGLDGG